MRKWPVEVVDWMRENTAGRTTKELTTLINQQGFDKKYGMVFTKDIINSIKSRYGLKSGTPKGYPSKYPGEIYPRHCQGKRGWRNCKRSIRTFWY